jgi:transposase
MSVDHIQDIEVLRQMVKLQQTESARLKSELTEAYAQLRDKDPRKAEQLALQLHDIETKHAKALKLLFGAKSERDVKGRARSAKKGKAVQTGHGPKEQPRLPLEEVVHELPQSEALCDLCGAQMPAWKDQFEDSSEIDFVEPKLVLKYHRRQKYRCACGGCIKTAPAPRKLFAKARYSIDFAVNVVLRKYCYHQPLERQRQELNRYGLDVSTATLWDYLHATFELVKPAYEQLGDFIVKQPIIGIDETSWRLLKGEKRGKSKTWWVWARHCPTAVHYTLDPSRGGEVAAKLLSGVHGIALCDGYAVYPKIASLNPNLRLAHCWAHARRELLPFDKDPRARRAIRVIQRMYRLESLADGQPDAERLRIRQRKTKPLLRAFFRWIDSLAIPPTSDLRNALRYIQLRKDALMLFLDEPLLAPDNNATERSIRSVVIGKKNHYGSSSTRGTQVAAVFYSLLESAHLAGVNPHDYLRAAVHAALDGKPVPMPHEFS